MLHHFFPYVAGAGLLEASLWAAVAMAEVLKLS